MADVTIDAFNAAAKKAGVDPEEALAKLFGRQSQIERLKAVSDLQKQHVEALQRANDGLQAVRSGTGKVPRFIDLIATYAGDGYVVITKKA